VPTAEFRDLGERAAVDQTLSRLTRQGAIRPGLNEIAADRHRAGGDGHGEGGT
jgi:hypothetical protein